MPSMDLYNCTVRHGGEMSMTIRKNGVTAPELLMLRTIHGKDAVVEIVKAGKTERTTGDELDRMSTIYGSPRVQAAWPGLRPSLPRTLKEAGLHESGRDLDDPDMDRLLKADRTEADTMSALSPKHRLAIEALADNGNQLV